MAPDSGRASAPDNRSPYRICLASASKCGSNPLTMRYLSTIILCIAFASACLGQEAATGDPDAESASQAWSRAAAKPLQFVVEGGAVHQFEASIDSGGDFDVDRFYIQPGLRWRASESVNVSLGLGFGYDSYSFDGGGFAALRPWSDIRTARIGAFVQWQVNEKWNVFAIPSLRSAFETGADLDSGLQGGLLGGFSYKVNENLSIGPGIGWLTQIEDSDSIFPILLIDWKVSDGLALRTGRGLGATQGPGLQLAWTLAPDWEIVFGGRYERLRFRLDDDGIAPEGVGEEQSIPLYVGATWRMSQRVELSVLGGVNLAGELRLEDEDGNLLVESDNDPAPFIGVIFRARF